MRNNKATLALAAMLIAVGAVSFLVIKWPNLPRAAARASAAAFGTPATTGAAPKVAKAKSDAAVSKVSPYAVVLNGICVPGNDPDYEKASRKKWEALLRDPFWQSIYPGVDPEKFGLVKTSLPLQRYVNYWKMKDDQWIHWTGKKILIPAGTRVFADGQGDMYLCACGNQVAAVLPPGKTGTVLPPGEEPPVAYLVPPEPDPSPVSPGGTPVWPPEMAMTTPYSESESIYPKPPIYPGGPTPWGSGPGPGLIPEVPGLPLAVPDSGTFSLIPVSLGAFILALRYRKRR